MFNKEDPDSFLGYPDPEKKTIDIYLKDMLAAKPDAKHFSERKSQDPGSPFEWKTRREVFELCQSFAKGLKELGLVAPCEVEAGKLMSCLGSITKNTMNAGILRVGCMLTNVVTFGLYAGHNKKALSGILERTGISTLCLHPLYLSLAS